MFRVELNEEVFEKCVTSKNVLDVLYCSELNFDECINVLNSLVNSFTMGKLIGMKLDKESIKKLRDSMQEDIDEYNTKKADEIIIDFHK